jgi:hypothetical protein
MSHPRRKAAAGLRVALLVALPAAGCSGSSGSPAVATAPAPVSTVARLSIALSGAPSFSVEQSATTYPIALRAFRGDGTLITGGYAQQVIVVLIPPPCMSGLGLQGGFSPTQPVYVPVTTGVCPPGTSAPFGATAVASSSTAIALTWDGTPISSSGELYAYANDVPQVTLTFP